MSPLEISTVPSTATAKDDDHIQTGSSNRKRKSSLANLQQIDMYGWQDFEDGIPGAVCKYCKGRPTIAPPPNGTFNFESPVESCCAQSTLDRYMDLRKDGFLVRKFDPDVYKEAVSLAIIEHGYPLTYAEHESITAIHSYLNSEFKPICSNTVKNHVMIMHKREKTRLKGFMHKIPGNICLTCDMWTSLVGQDYLSLTAHFIDAEWNPHAKILNFCCVEFPHSAAVLQDTIFSLLKEWGIHEKILTITLDNARCHDDNHDIQITLADNLSMYSLLPCDGEYLHVSCGAQLFSLIVEEGFKVIDEGVCKLRNLVNYIVSSKRRISLFRENALDNGIDCSQNLCLDCPTSWPSTYKMIDRAMPCHVVFSNMKRIERFDPHFPPPPTEEEWSRIKKIFVLLKPFHDIASGMSANLYLKSVWRIGFSLLSYLTCEDELVRDMAKRMKVKFDAYWVRYSPVLSFAAILDPRFKFQFVVHCFRKLDPESAEVKAKHVKEQFYEFFRQYVKPNSEQSANEAVHLDDFEGFSDFDDPDFPAIKSQLDMYLAEFKLDHMQNLDVLMWWKVNGERFPQVADMARDFLAIPLTAAASESPFSMGRRIIAQRKSYLRPQTSEALLTTRTWILGFEMDEGEDEDQDFNGLEFQLLDLKINGGGVKVEAHP